MVRSWFQRILLAITFVCAISVISATSALAVGHKYVVSQNSWPVNVRGIASKNGNVVDTLVTGTEVEVVSSDNNWSHIQVGDTDGYIMNIYLTDRDPLNSSVPETGILYVETAKNGYVNLYNHANEDSRIIDALADGTAVKLKKSDGEWCQVSVVASGKNGYIRNEYLTANTDNSKPLSQSGTKAYTVSQNGKSINIRSGAGKKHDVLLQVPSGTEVTLVQPGSNWSRIQVNGMTGYIENELLSKEKAASNKNTLYVVSVNSAPVNMRASASRNSNVVEELVTGTEVVVDSVHSNWTKVKVNGKTGYIMNLYLSEEKPGYYMNKDSYTAYVTSENGGKVNMRYGAGKGYHVVTALDCGEKVTVLAHVKGWARVRSNQYEGYISEEFLTNQK